MLGYVDDEEGPGLVSQWYPNGSVMDYLRRHEDADRNLLVRDIQRDSALRSQLCKVRRRSVRSLLSP